MPPPPEILENLTAKGGDLRNRTLENFHAPASRDSGMLADGLESADDEQRTPKADHMDVDEPGSAGRYPTSKQLSSSCGRSLSRCLGRGKLKSPP